MKFSRHLFRSFLGSITISDHLFAAQITFIIRQNMICRLKFYFTFTFSAVLLYLKNQFDKENKKRNVFFFDRMKLDQSDWIYYTTCHFPLSLKKNS